MMRIFGLVLALLPLVSCASNADSEPYVVEYYCEEVLVVGRAKVLSYTDMTSTGDALGHGKYDLEITIKKLLYGDESQTHIKAYYYAHNEIRDDIDFVFALSPTPEGYLMRSGNIWNARTKKALAKSCS